MNELTLNFDNYDWFNKELETYVLSLKGVIDTKIHDNAEEIYIKYDSPLTSLKMLKLEVLAFVSSHQLPIIIAFDKHS